MPAMTRLYETHMHTPLCGHARGEPEEYAAVAAARGLGGVVVTCHNPMPEGYSPRVRMRADQFPQYVEMVARAREAMAPRVDVRLGFECDYYPGAESWLENQLRSAEFHYVLGSVHPHLSDYRKMFDPGDPAEYHRVYFDHLARAAETGLFDALSHPDLIKMVTGDAWDPPAILDLIRGALDRIAGTGVAMELNTSGLNKKVAEMYPGPLMLREMRQRDIPVVIGADAHDPARAGDGFDLALDALAEAGYTRTSYFLDRRRQDVNIAEVRKTLR